MSIAAALTPWFGRPRARRGVVAGVRTRTSARERRLAWQVGLGVAGALAIALLLVWIRLQVVRTGYELSAARQLELKLEQEQRELALEVAALTSPRRLEEVARERLGMRPPAPGQIVSPP